MEVTGIQRIKSLSPADISESLTSLNKLSLPLVNQWGAVAASRGGGREPVVGGCLPVGGRLLASRGTVTNQLEDGRVPVEGQWYMGGPLKYGCPFFGRSQPKRTGSSCWPISTNLLQGEVRTNNHLERCNRVIRYLEKVRYKWRRRRTIVRHILLQFQYWNKPKENPANLAA